MIRENPLENPTTINLVWRIQVEIFKRPRRLIFLLGERHTKKKLREKTSPPVRFYGSRFFFFFFKLEYKLVTVTECFTQDPTILLFKGTRKSSPRTRADVRYHM